MIWCRCPKCNHKLFLYDEPEQKTHINIKCTSCKSLLDMILSKEEVEVVVYERQSNAG